MENPIKIDDLGVPPFKETPICCFQKLSSKMALEVQNPSDPWYTFATYKCLPGTQMTLVLTGQGLVFQGSTLKHGGH